MDNMQIEVTVQVSQRVDWSKNLVLAGTAQKVEGSMDLSQTAEEVRRIINMAQGEVLRQLGISQEIKRLEQSKQITVETHP